MDLIGHDTNFAVTESVFAANFYESASSLRWCSARWSTAASSAGSRGAASSPIRRRRRAAAPAFEPPPVPVGAIVALHGRGVAVDRWAARLGEAGIAFESDPASRWNGLQTQGGELRLTDGRPAAQVAAEEGVRDLALYDLATAKSGGAPGVALAFAVSAGAAPPGATRPPPGSASPAGRRSRSAMRPAWWSRAPWRC